MLRIALAAAVLVGCKDDRTATREYCVSITPDNDMRELREP